MYFTVAQRLEHWSPAQLYVETYRETCSPVICGWVEISGWKKIIRIKKVFQNYIVSYALKIGVYRCVCNLV